MAGKPRISLSGLDECLESKKSGLGGLRARIQADVNEGVLFRVQNAGASESSGEGHVGFSCCLKEGKGMNDHG